LNVAIDVHGDVLKQIERIPLDPDRPLIVTDADEVLCHFIVGLERVLERQALRFDLVGFAITGNVKHRNGVALSPAEVSEQIELFFESETESIEPVDGAARALAALSAQAQILVLSNVPMPALAARARWLARHGMDYPLVANIGRKGPALRHLAARAGRPVLFIDDIPHNLTSVAEHAPDVLRIQYIADPRLSRAVPRCPDCHHRAADWADIRAFAEARIGAASAA
jgi:hypothetical protein